MAVAEANALLDLITKATAFAQQTALGWYKASQALKLFPIRLAVLRQQSNSWTSLLHRYGMSADPFIGPVLEVAVQLLAREELKLMQVQQSCCLTIGTRLLFPESLIGALDSVITAFQTLPELITEQETRRQQLEKVCLYRVTRLPFLPDSKYVPFEASITKVRAALESQSTGPIVVISGGPGQGKSSMAKYLACLYQDGIDPLHPTPRCQEQIRGNQIAPPKKFVDGVFFLRCGQKADSKSLLLKLWQDLGYQTLPMSIDQGPASSIEEMPLTSEDAMHKQLSARLANLNALIILDDVWNHLIVDRLLVQQQGIKYLITTQVPRLWTDSTCVDIPISLPTSREANQILANHVKGFPEEVTSDIQDQISLIIEKSASNPLVLANVATNIGVGKALHLQEWKSTVQYLSDLQDGDDKRPVSLFGRTYSKRTMRASTEMALSSFSNEEQTLLFLGSICESQAVPEVVFKTLFKIVHSSLAKFSRCCEQLENINFIQIESKKDPSTDLPQRSWSLHTMRQNFISLIKKEEIALMCSKLLENTQNDNIVAILLVLYGQESWRNQAASRLGIPISQIVNVSSKLGSSRLFSIRPFVRLLNADGEEEWQKQSHQVTKQILEEYLFFGALNQKMIIELLCMQQTLPGACQALLQLAILNQKPLFKDSNDQILQKLMNLLQQASNNSQNQLGEVVCLLDSLIFCNFEDSIKIGSYCGAVETLVTLLEEQQNPFVQEHATWALAYLSKDVVNNATKIGSCPGALERLIGFLDEGVNPNLQASAISALAYLSKDVLENATKIGSHSGAVERLVGLLGDKISLHLQTKATFALALLSKDVMHNAIKIGSYPGAMERLLEFLQDNKDPFLQQNAASALACLSTNVVDNAIKIGSYPSAVERLIGLLGEGHSPDLQLNAAGVLGNISNFVVDNATKIGSYPGAMERLVELLGEGVSPGVQANAAWALSCVSEDVGNATKIGSYQGVIERLVELLGKGQSPNVQTNAARTLSHLSKHVINATKIGSYPDAIKRLVKLLAEGLNSSVQTNAAATLRNLSEDVVDNASKIGSYPGAVERLVKLLAKGLSPSVQSSASSALGYLSKDVEKNSIEIGSYPGAIERLVELLGEGGNLDIQTQAILALGYLSKDVVDNATKIGSYPGVVERLVGLLGKGPNASIQASAAWVLHNLSVDVEHAIKIGSYPGVVETLVELLGKGQNPIVQTNAVLVIANLSRDVVENATKIGSYPGAVERLVGLLEEGGSPSVQINALVALGLLSEDVKNATKIGSYPGALEILVGLIGEGVSPCVQINALVALGLLCKDVVENATKIGSYPGALERLVGLLGEGVSSSVQINALVVLGLLSKDVQENATKIVSYPGLLGRLVELLGEEESLDVLINTTSMTLAYLSQNVVDNATTIGSYPGVVERLVGLLGNGLSPGVQANAAMVLGLLSKDVVSNATKIGSYPGAMERLICLLAEDVSAIVKINAAMTLVHLSNEEVNNAITIESYPGAVERIVALLGV